MAVIRGLLASCALLATALPAAAQISAEGGAIYIDSARTESLQRERKVLLIGAVDIQQADGRLRADRVTIQFSGNGDTQSSGIGSGFGDIQSMLAEGQVYYVTPELKARGDRGVYDAAADTITLTGNVALQRGCDVARGATLKLEIGNGRSILDGGSGRAQSVIRPGGEDQVVGAPLDCGLEVPSTEADRG